MFKTIQKVAFCKAQDIAKLKKSLGYLLGMQTIRKGKKQSFIYKFIDKDGKHFHIWGCTAMNQNLLVDTAAKQPALDEHFLNALVRLTYEGKIKVKGRSQPMKSVLVEVDFSDVYDPKTAKDYMETRREKIKKVARTITQSETAA